MKKYIKIGNGEQFPVPEVYPYIYSGGIGKQVLRIVVDPSTKTYDELFNLLNNSNLTISEFRDNEQTGDKTLAAEYVGYDKDYKCSYNGDPDYPNQYFIELTRKTATEMQAEKNQELMNANNAILLSLFEEKGGK